MEGNQQKMREALVELTDKVLDYLHKGLILLPLPLDNATAKARAALSAPARQCDVGAAEEQYRRWIHFCEQRLHRCSTCECSSLVGGCTFKFGDMPYEAQEGGAE